jgi:hypothetical protein
VYAVDGCGGFWLCFVCLEGGVAGLDTSDRSVKASSRPLESAVKLTVNEYKIYTDGIQTSKHVEMKYKHHNIPDVI